MHDALQKKCPVQSVPCKSSCSTTQDVMAAAIVETIQDMLQHLWVCHHTSSELDSLSTYPGDCRVVNGSRMAGMLTASSSGLRSSGVLMGRHPETAQSRSWRKLGIVQPSEL